MFEKLTSTTYPYYKIKQLVQKVFYYENSNVWLNISEKIFFLIRAELIFYFTLPKILYQLWLDIFLWSNYFKVGVNNNFLEFLEVGEG